ncbi:hypothetical protein [Desulfuromonas acetoxidans]|uniref:hypothetical protein n=1 Tax=Desulfuromonas acetoxidans TaxID=891 RepID=UPI002931B366|nr:hypothetical protein [Desulfuromonas acetoxidans]
MTIRFNNLKPYVSVLLTKSVDDQNVGRVRQVLDDIKPLLPERTSFSAIKVEVQNCRNNDEVEVGYLHYQEKKNPSWFDPTPQTGQDEEGRTSKVLEDLTNHLILICRRGDYFGIYFSDNARCQSISSQLGKDEHRGLGKIQKVPEAQIKAAFLKPDSLKTLWLSGIHRNTPVKADSKVLSGSDLRHALDPLSDQTYAFTAVKGGLLQISDEKSASVGLNPGNAKLWVGPSGDWDTFKSMLSSVLGRLEAAEGGQSDELPVLARCLNSLDDIEDAFDFSILPIEMHPEDIGDDLCELIQELEFSYRFQVVGSNGHDFTLNLLEVIDGREGEQIAQIQVSLLFDKGKVSSALESSGIPEGKEQFVRKVERLLRKRDLIRVWYESGHTFADGKIHSTQYRDVEFDRGKFIWADFSDYNIDQEKPLIDENNGGTIKRVERPDLTGGRNSLFCWVREHWDGIRLGEKTNTPRGWLVCDDGAGEKADFIHLSVPDGDEDPILSLIHVKAAGSDGARRGISVGAHDIVLSQAVKNIRYIDRKSLAATVAEAASERVRNLVWFDGQQRDRGEFVDAVRALGERCKKRVVVVQPHTRESAYQPGDQSNRRRQLDMLLVSTEATIRGLGAEFIMVGCADD